MSSILNSTAQLSAALEQVISETFQTARVGVFGDKTFPYIVAIGRWNQHTEFSLDTLADELALRIVRGPL
jgi:hypothetical protein